MGKVNLPAIVLLGLIAHIVFIHVQRGTYDLCTALVALLFNLRLIILLGLIAHIVLIYVQRGTFDFCTAFVALLSIRLIILLGLIATLSALWVLHFGLRDYFWGLGLAEGTRTVSVWRPRER